MNKRIIQALIVLIVILFGVSFISDLNESLETNSSIKEFEQQVSNQEEIENGNMDGVHVIAEDSSNLISDINAKIAGIVVGGLNKLFSIGIKMIEGLAGN